MDVAEAIGHKVGPLPVWGWGVAGVGGVLLVAWASGRQGTKSAGVAGTEALGYAAPTTDQMSAAAINDLKNALSADQAATGEAIAGTQAQLTAFAEAQSGWIQALIDQDAQQQSSLMGQMQANAAAYQEQLAANQSGFLAALQGLMHSGAAPNGTAPVQSGSSSDPLLALPSWARDLLAAHPDRRTSHYLFKNMLSPDGPYSEALNAYARSDSPGTGGVTTGPISTAARQQLSQLMASGEAVDNPVYGH